MKKPKYMEELLKSIFLWLGIAFIAMGFLGFIGVMKPKESSLIQEPFLLGAVFVGLGLVFVIVSIILGIITTKKNKEHSELIANGIQVKGIIKEVYLQTGTQYGKQSPYRVVYAYTYQSEEYHCKSYFLWEKPNLAVGDSIIVYVNNDGKSTVKL